MSAKYKVGDQKVLVVDEIALFFNSWNNIYFPYKFSGRQVCMDDNEKGLTHYLICEKNEKFNYGDLIAAECLFSSIKNQINYVVWKRIGDEVTKTSPIRIKPKKRS